MIRTRLFVICLALVYCLLVAQSNSVAIEDSFDWGRFPDDQIRRLPSSSLSSTSSKAQSERNINTEHNSVVAPSAGVHHYPTLLPRVNDFNAINRNFTANRGAFGFRKPKKSKQESKPAISKQQAVLRAKQARLAGTSFNPDKSVGRS